MGLCYEGNRFRNDGFRGRFQRLAECIEKAVDLIRSLGASLVVIEDVTVRR